MKKLLTLVVLLSAATIVNADEGTNQANSTWNIYNNTNYWFTVSAEGSIGIHHSRSDIFSSGFNFVELDSNNDSTMTPVIGTLTGSLYELLFDYSPRINQPSIANGIATSWNRSLVAEIAGVSSVSNAWITQQFYVTDAGDDALQLTASHTNDNRVPLNAVPLPTAAWLFASALALFGLARRNSI